MDSKICFKCNENKELNKFYKHPKTSDGFFNKCIECSKKDSVVIYNKNMLNNEWVIKERKRQNEKKKRLGYNEKYKINFQFDNSKYKNASRKFNIKKPNEIHHWCYFNGFEYDIIVLELKDHKKLHSNIKRNKGEYIFYTNDGVILDTKEKHVNFINSLDINIINIYNG